MGPIPPVALALVLALPAPGNPSASSASGGASSGVAHVQDEGVRQELAALRRELRNVYEDLAAWCHEAKLYRQRDRMLAGLLLVDPDHAEARKRLAYRWNRKDEVWERKRYREPKDRGSPEDVAAWEALITGKAEGLRDRLLLFTSKPGVTREMREREAALYLPLAPEDPFLRRALGQVSGGEEGVWLSADAVRTRNRREEIQALLVEAGERVPELEPWEMGYRTHDLPLRWNEAVRTNRIQLAGTVTSEEIQESTWIAHRLCEFLPEVLPSERYRRTIGDDVEGGEIPITFGRYTIYLLQGPTETPVLLEGWPELTANQRELAPQLSSSWLDSFHSVGVWHPAREKRLDGLVRQIVGMYLGDNFGITSRHGWVWEGLGFYLTHLAVGTRLTFFVRPERQGTGTGEMKGEVLGERLMAPDANWLAILVEELQRPRPPRLVYLMGKDVNSMSIREVLLAHGLAAYLIEMHPELLPRILAKMGRQGEPTEVLERELSRRLPDIEKDLLEWAHMAIRL